MASGKRQGTHPDGMTWTVPGRLVLFYILVIGEKEEVANTVQVRLRDDGKVVGSMSVDGLLERLQADKAAFK